MAGMRPEPLLLSPESCAARLPRGFRRLMDNFAREVLRLQPCELNAFGAAYFAELVQSRNDSFVSGGQTPVYHPKTSYIKAQFALGNKVVVPTEDENLMSTQTTGERPLF
ncbi:hypothetical protein BV898_05192 [Hypsibius exemplaris]|uniref:RIIa domain-containing protein n=1 Tax=Hypsibius exemplaris TaxID=2072580 RepID=A0A1W0X099_HYPEX|nr:hypothetical protein BV898_05192 [Hypsibius exemplaris]